MNFQYVLDQMDQSIGGIDQTTAVMYADNGSISYLNVYSRYWPIYQEWLAEGNIPLPPA